MADHTDRGGEASDAAVLGVVTFEPPPKNPNGNCKPKQQIPAEETILTPLETWQDPYRNVPIPVYIWRKEGSDFVLSDFNKEAEALTSGGIRKHLGITASEYLDSDPESLANLHLCFERRSVLRREGYYTTQSTGESKYLVIQWVFAPPDLVIVHILDSTERKRIEEENRILARFPEDSPNPILRVGPSDVIQYANPAAAVLLKQWGCSIGDVLPDALTGILGRLRGKEKSMEFELSAGIRVYLMTAHAVRKTDSIYFYGNDITDLKDAQERLNLTARVFECTIEGILLTDSSGKIVSVNAAFTEITGYRPEDALGKTPRVLKSNRHPADFYNSIWQELTQKGMWQGEIWNQRKNGEIYPQWTTISAIKDNE
jgi:PAS domain S-box-containing protein